uniref:Uncharacterized protein n=1 Tax=viral metagenome TaxID=1070528 RepID=A0A6C0JG71_9ZZZZ
MYHNHAFAIEKLKTDFDNILTLKKEITKIKLVVSEKLSELKIQYNELVKVNGKKIFLFCLDSFYFQYKTFSMELEHIDRSRSLINNRTYCDYFKLYNIIISFVKENKSDLDINEFELKSYPVYKDLEPFQEYKLEDIKDVHSNILLLINKLYLQLNNKMESVDQYNENHRIGFSISNFLNTLQYENRLLEQQISLYLNYVSFFHISQKRQLNRLFIKMQEFYREIDENININRTFTIEDIGEQEKLQRFFVIGEDVRIDNILEDSEFLHEQSKLITKKVVDVSLNIIDPSLNVDLSSNSIVKEKEKKKSKAEKIEINT